MKSQWFCVTSYVIFLIGLGALYWSHSCLMYAHLMVMRGHLVQTVLHGRPIEQHEAIVADFLKDIDRVKPMPKQPWFYVWWVNRFSDRYDPMGRA